MAGIVIAMPFQLWNWAEKIDAPQQDMSQWHNCDFKEKIETLSDLPVFLKNDASAACKAELIFGRGTELKDFVYFFIGTFIDGGIVLNHLLHCGQAKNVATFSFMPINIPQSARSTPLIDNASIYVLENMLVKHNVDPSPLWVQTNDWSALDDNIMHEWINMTAQSLALAIISSYSALHFECRNHRWWISKQYSKKSRYGHSRRTQQTKFK